MFTALDNKLVGQNIAKLRRHRDIKASDMAGRLHISEPAYTKYERGETAITLEFLNKVAEQFDVNPAEFLNATPQNIVENIHDSNVYGLQSTGTTINVTNEKEIIDTILEQNKKLTALMEKLMERL
ncbi:helix-turn-helix domain-containing protein [Chitinophagaceae bacterium MMS25-I14]